MKLGQRDFAIAGTTLLAATAIAGMATYELHRIGYRIDAAAWILALLVVGVCGVWIGALQNGPRQPEAYSVFGTIVSVGGILAIALYSWTQKAPQAVFANCLLLAFAAGVLGSLLGFTATRTSTRSPTG